MCLVKLRGNVDNKKMVSDQGGVMALLKICGVGGVGDDFLHMNIIAKE